MMSRLARWLIVRICGRPADVSIGGERDPYLRRWWVIPRNPLFNIYLHQFLRDDDDRALHDHPWFSLSLVLAGRLREHTIDRGGIHRRRELAAGTWRLRSAWFAHRLELPAGDCWTLFITGPVLRRWGFHCPSVGWRYWREFTDPSGMRIGRGCDA